MEQSFGLSQQIPHEKVNASHKEKVHVATEYEKLLKGYSVFRKKIFDARLELQEHHDMVNIFFTDPENAANVHEAEERIKEIDFWFAHEMPSEELEQIRRFEEAGYLPWTNMNGEIRFMKNSPEDMNGLLEPEMKSLHLSWRNAGLEMRAEIQCIDERIKQLQVELETQKQEFRVDGPGGIVAKEDLYSASIEQMIESLATQKERLIFLKEGLQEYMLELIPIAKKFGYAPIGPDPFARLAKEENVQ